MFSHQDSYTVLQIKSPILKIRPEQENLPHPPTTHPAISSLNPHDFVEFFQNQHNHTHFTLFLPSAKLFLLQCLLYSNAPQTLLHYECVFKLTATQRSEWRTTVQDLGITIHAQSYTEYAVVEAIYGLDFYSSTHFNFCALHFVQSFAQIGP